jgi:hypothetical protein
VLDGDYAGVVVAKRGVQLLAGEGGWRGPGDGFGAGLGQEGAVGHEAELAGEEGVVAQLGMAVEGEVAAVNSEVGAERGGEAGVVGTGEGLRGSPVEAVVDDEKIDADGGGALEGDAASVDGSADFGDAAVVLKLEAV